MAVDQLLTERRGDVLVLTLNRPERLNAAPPSLFEDIAAALANLDGARAVLIQGAGRAFCSGADVGAGALSAADPGAATHAALTDSYNPAILAVAEARVPVVSAVRGAAAGIGCSLALAADFCVASDSGYFLIYPKENENDPRISAFRKWLLTRLAEEMPEHGDLILEDSPPPGD